MNDAVREAELRRLEVLEMQIAQMGINTPPHITVEARTIRAKLGLPDVVAVPTVEQNTRAMVTAVNGLLRDMDFILRQLSQLYTRMVRIEEAAQRDKEERQQRDKDERQERQERQELQDATWHDFRQTQRFIVIAMVAVSAIVLFLVTR